VEIYGQLLKIEFRGRDHYLLMLPDRVGALYEFPVEQRWRHP
jgi:hypothetical protein